MLMKTRSVAIGIYLMIFLRAVLSPSLHAFLFSGGRVHFQIFEFIFSFYFFVDADIFSWMR